MLRPGLAAQGSHQAGVRKAGANRARWADDSLTVTGLGGGGDAGGGLGCGVICAAPGTYSATSRQSRLRVDAVGSWAGKGQRRDTCGTWVPGAEPRHASPGCDWTLRVTEHGEMGQRELSGRATGGQSWDVGSGRCTEQQRASPCCGWTRLDAVRRGERGSRWLVWPT